MQIIPVVMEKQWDAALERLERVYQTSNWVQIDVTDGEMVTGKSFEMEPLNKFEFSEKMLWDIHLLVKEPIKWVEKCIFVGAARIIGQVEMMGNRDEFVKRIKDEGIEAGVGFDIETEVENIPEEIDLVLLMSRKAGYVQTEIDNRIWDKIDKLKLMRKEKERDFLIAVDGGVNPKNIEELKKAGVDVVYSEGSYFELIDNVKEDN